MTNFFSNYSHAKLKAGTQLLLHSWSNGILSIKIKKNYLHNCNKKSSLKWMPNATAKAKAGCWLGLTPQMKQQNFNRF
jgi:hypothetical protein